MNKRCIFWIVAGILFFQISPAFADSSSESDDMRTMLESLKQQVANMQDTIDRQNVRIQELEAKSAVVAAPSSSEPVKITDDDFQKSLKKNVGDAIPWMKGIKSSGDLRLRYEGFDYYNKNDDAGSTGTASDRTRNRFRIRLRWGLEKDYGDDWKVGFRLATGNNTDPTSTNQTLGNIGHFTFKTINVDRAYATYEPSALKDRGILTGIKIGAGKVENPFYRYSTGIIWDGDVTPEGLYEQANLLLINTDTDKLYFQATSGQFIINENTGVDTDANLFGYQGALTWKTSDFHTAQPVDIATAVSYYDHTNWFRTVLAANNTAATSFLRTNSIVADSFRVLDVYPEITFNVKKDLPLTLWSDYVFNTANVGTEDIVQSSGNDIHDSDSAWGLGLKLGKAKKKASWELAYGYYEIGVNATVAAFSEADYGGPGQNGFTNRKGHRLGLVYQMTDDLSLSLTGYFMRPLHPFSGNAVIGIQNSSNEDVFRSQVDLSYKF